MSGLEQILKRVQSGELDIGQAKSLIAEAGAERVADLGFAQLDLDRDKRTGFPEVVFGEGKTVDQLIPILRKLTEHSDRVLATRISADKAEAVTAVMPEFTYHEAARALTWFKKPILRVYDGYVAVVCAGTSDVSPRKRQLRRNAWAAMWSACTMSE